MRTPFYLLVLATLCSLAAGAGKQLAETKQLPEWDELAFNIEDSKSRVGIAPIYLSVSRLTPESGNLVGTYSIEVPIMNSKNDFGKIVLPLDVTVAELGKNGGVLRGNAYSEKKDKPPNKIVCRILPHNNQQILLAITTADRTLNFESRYTIIKLAKDS
ncbi:hypothetical protein [Coraliomargarita parva]|uniref:hypothetical protein n=1 Tax=Coraliomargarita parva TaxID=3014050 RepID=UPI0022B504CD|nr:hypothetical protein [Coraliomargarita parva]